MIPSHTSPSGNIQNSATPTERDPSPPGTYDTDHDRDPFKLIWSGKRVSYQERTTRDTAVVPNVDGAIRTQAFRLASLVRSRKEANTESKDSRSNVRIPTREECIDYTQTAMVTLPSF